MLQSIWGRRLVYLLGCVALLGLGVAIGRYATPAKVVVQTKTVVETKIVKVKVKDRQVNRTTTTVSEPTPAGPKVTTTTTEVATTHTTSDTTKDSDTHTESLRITTNRPDWRIGILGGALILRTSAGLETSWLVGAQAERRIAGPVSIGLWGLGGPKGGAVGGLVNLEF